MSATLRYAILFLLLAALVGCDEDAVPADYGQRGVGSVNGTDVLIDMFADAGHKTKVARSRLSERVGERTDVFVWTPDTYHLPSTEERAWFETWLSAKGGRTLIYIGRDYDAAPEFWRKILKGAPPDKITELERRLAEASSHASARRAEMPATFDCQWFRFIKDPPASAAGAPKPEPRLFGAASWTKGIDPALLEIEVRAPLDPVFDADVLLGFDGNVLVSRQKLPADDGQTSQIIVVANGAFLSNMGLVKHEHRKLAARLIGEVGAAKQVTFVESNDRGISFQAPEQPEETPEMQKWPPQRLRTTFLHLAALAIILIVSRWPIFGRPREEEPTHESDFGRHVEALGDLLSRGGHAGYAESRLEHYQKTMQEAAGKTRK
jgi:hypothetical protein